MKINKFEEIIAWQKAGELTVNIYGYFKTCKDFGFKDQIQRASVSIMNNIAEGFERKGNKEFNKFLFISKGSSGEVRSMLYLALKLGYISENDFHKLYALVVQTSKLTTGLAKSLNI